MNTIIRTASTDPYHNLALEDCLMATTELGAVLYLWQNQHTVVVGKHQNAWKECKVDLLEQEGGKLARRSTGGGAVYHDLGNLNFTFVMPSALYDVRRQSMVVLAALDSLGIVGELSGRNDLTICGAKFSGHAFRKEKDRCVHHGTLLFCVDMQKLSRYLQPSQAKLAAKGVCSVASRVTNLCEHHGSLSLEMLLWALERAFVEEYGPITRITEKALDPECIRAGQARYASWEWRLGRTPAFDAEYEQRFDFGSLTLGFSLKEGVVEKAQIYSDVNDEAYITRLSEALTGARFQRQELAGRVRALGGELASPIAAWLEELHL